MLGLHEVLERRAVGSAVPSGAQSAALPERRRLAGSLPRSSASYTPSMKTAVSIPDEVFEKVERFARRAKRSRSEVFSAALREYIARHAPEEVTDAINRAVDEIGDQGDEFVAAAARRVLEKTEW
jgi:predicted transcriptional regulator